VLNEGPATRAADQTQEHGLDLGKEPQELHARLGELDEHAKLENLGALAWKGERVSVSRIE
jgi:hypothetical protein